MTENDPTKYTSSFLRSLYKKAIEETFGKPTWFLEGRINKLDIVGQKKEKGLVFKVNRRKDTFCLLCYADNKYTELKNTVYKTCDNKAKIIVTILPLKLPERIYFVLDLFEILPEDELDNLNTAFSKLTFKSPKSQYCLSCEKLVNPMIGQFTTSPRLWMRCPECQKILGSHS